MSPRKPDELFCQLDSLKQTTKRSNPCLTTNANADFLSSNVWKTKELHLAVEEADKGIFVSNESVENWLSSWGETNNNAAPEADILPK